MARSTRRSTRSSTRSSTRRSKGTLRKTRTLRKKTKNQNRRRAGAKKSRTNRKRNQRSMRRRTARGRRSRRGGVPNISTEIPDISKEITHRCSNKCNLYNPIAKLKKGRKKCEALGRVDGAYNAYCACKQNCIIEAQIAKDKQTEHAQRLINETYQHIPFGAKEMAEMEETAKRIQARNQYNQ